MKISISAVPTIFGNELYQYWFEVHQAQKANGTDSFTPDLIHNGMDKETAYVLGTVYAATSFVLQNIVSYLTTKKFAGAWEKLVIHNDGTVEVHTPGKNVVIRALEGFGFDSYENLVKRCIMDYKSNLEGSSLAVTSLNKPVLINPTLMPVFHSLLHCKSIKHLTITVGPGVIEVLYEKKQSEWKLATKK